MDQQVELEICANCKREIPHTNYVMHTAHCARNITLCPTCKEPIPKPQFEAHKKSCVVKKSPAKPQAPQQPPARIEHSRYFMDQKTIEDKKVQQRNEKRLERMEKLVDTGNPLGRVSNSNGYHENNGASKKVVLPAPVQAPKTNSNLLPCQYCELELNKFDLGEHENYCGARTEKCQECGELVMFKYRQLHQDTNHGFVKLNDVDPGPRPSWMGPTRVSLPESPTRRRPSPFRSFSTFDPYTPPGYPFATSFSGSAIPTLNTNNNNGQAPQPPSRRRNPPTELVIPCEFCGLPIPHEDLVEHETGCRPDLARFNPRRRSDSPDYFIAPEPSSPDVELPCEFCADLIPASRLLSHQATCN